MLPLLLMLFACRGDDGTKPQEDEAPVVVREMSVELPADAAYSAEDLQVDSLFSDSTPATSDEVSVDEQAETSAEFMMAVNDADGIVLLSMFDPSDSGEVELNSTTTTVALFLMQPWVMDLKPATRLQVRDEIQNHPDFPAVRTVVETALQTASDDPLLQQDVVDALASLSYSMGVQTSQTVINGPLQFDLDTEAPPNKTVISNPYSSAGYQVGLYRADALPENGGTAVASKFVKGISKSAALLNDIGVGILVSSSVEDTEVAFENIEEGNWVFRASNGLDFVDGGIEGELAAKENTVVLAKQVVGLVLPLASEFISGACGQALMDTFTGVPAFVVTVEDWREQSARELTTNVLNFILGRIDSLSDVATCTTAVESAGSTKKNFWQRFTKGPAAKRLLKAVSFIGNAQSAFDLGAFLGDWVAYDFTFTQELTVGSGCTVTLDFSSATVNINSELAGYFDTSSCVSLENRVADLNSDPDTENCIWCHMSWYSQCSYSDSGMADWPGPQITLTSSPENTDVSGLCQTVGSETIRCTVPNDFYSYEVEEESEEGGPYTYEQQSSYYGNLIWDTGIDIALGYVPCEGAFWCQEAAECAVLTYRQASWSRWFSITEATCGSVISIGHLWGNNSCDGYIW